MIRTTSQNSYINTRGSHPEVSYQKTILNILQNSQKNIYAVVSFLRKLLTENLKMSEAATVDLLMFCKNRCSLKMRLVFQNQPFIDPLQNRCSWIIRKIHRKNLCWSLFLIKMQFWEPSTLLTKTPTQAFSCEIWKLFKINYFEGHLWTSASKLYLKRNSNTGVFLWILCIIREHLFCKGSMKHQCAVL